MTDEHGRPDPPLDAGEVETLLGFLDLQRATLAWTCAGLDDAQLRARLPPTAMTLAGLLVHLARVEDTWFSEVVAEAPTMVEEYARHNGHADLLREAVGGATGE